MAKFPYRHFYTVSSGLSSGTNVNVASPVQLEWADPDSSGGADPDYFSWDAGSPEVITVEQDVDVLLILNAPLVENEVSPIGNERARILAQLQVDGSDVSNAVARAFIRLGNPGGTDEVGCLTLYYFRSYTAGEEISIDLSGIAALTNSITLDGDSTISLLALPPESEGGPEVFSALFDDVDSGGATTNLNQGTASPAIFETPDREDSSYTYSGGSPTIVTFDDAGDYLVFLNVPMSSAVARASVEFEIEYNSVNQEGGPACQGYIRNDDGDSESTAHWVGAIIEGSGGNDLRIMAHEEATSGTVTTGSLKAQLTVIRIPSGERGAYVSSSQLEGATNPTNFNQPTYEPLRFNSLASDSSLYTTFPTVGREEIRVDVAGTYMQFLSGAFERTSGATGVRDYLQFASRIEGTIIDGGTASPAYIRSAGGHEKASLCMCTTVAVAATEKFSWASRTAPFGVDTPTAAVEDVNDVVMGVVRIPDVITATLDVAAEDASFDADADRIVIADVDAASEVAEIDFTMEIVTGSLITASLDVAAEDAAFDATAAHLYLTLTRATSWLLDPEAYLEPSPATSALDRVTDMHFEAWVHIESLSDTRTIFSKWATDAEDQQYRLVVNSGVIEWQVRDVSDSIETVSFSEVEDNTWYAVYCYIDGTSGEIGIRVGAPERGLEGIGKTVGELSDRETLSGTFTAPGSDTADPFRIGYDNDDTGFGYFVGLIERVRVWSTLLSEANEETLYNGRRGIAYPGIPGGLLTDIEAAWELNEYTESTGPSDRYDSSPNAVTLGEVVVSKAMESGIGWPGFLSEPADVSIDADRLLPGTIGAEAEDAAFDAAGDRIITVGGQAAQFSGSGEYLSGSNAGFTISIDDSYEIWVRHDATNPNGVAVLAHWDVTLGRSFRVWIDASDQVNLSYWNGSGTTTVTYTSSTVLLEAWHQIIVDFNTTSSGDGEGVGIRVTRQGDPNYLYTAGPREFFADAGFSGPTSAADMLIGLDPTGTNDPLEGHARYLKHFRRVLAQEDADELWNCGNGLSGDETDTRNPLSDDLALWANLLEYSDGTAAVTRVGDFPTATDFADNDDGGGQFVASEFGWGGRLCAGPATAAITADKVVTASLDVAAEDAAFDAAGDRISTADIDAVSEDAEASIDGTRISTATLDVESEDADVEILVSSTVTATLDVASEDATFSADADRIVVADIDAVSEDAETEILVSSTVTASLDVSAEDAAFTTDVDHISVATVDADAEDADFTATADIVVGATLDVASEDASFDATADRVVIADLDAASEDAEAAIAGDKLGVATLDVEAEDATITFDADHLSIANIDAAAEPAQTDITGEIIGQLGASLDVAAEDAAVSIDATRIVTASLDVASEDATFDATAAHILLVDIDAAAEEATFDTDVDVLSVASLDVTAEDASVSILGDRVVIADLSAASEDAEVDIAAEIVADEISATAGFESENATAVIDATRIVTASLDVAAEDADFAIQVARLVETSVDVVSEDADVAIVADRVIVTTLDVTAEDADASVTADRVVVVDIDAQAEDADVAVSGTRIITATLDVSAGDATCDIVGEIPLTFVAAGFECGDATIAISATVIRSATLDVEAEPAEADLTGTHISVATVDADAEDATFAATAVFVQDATLDVVSEDADIAITGDRVIETTASFEAETASVSIDGTKVATVSLVVSADGSIFSLDGTRISTAAALFQAEDAQVSITAAEAIEASLALEAGPATFSAILSRSLLADLDLVCGPARVRIHEVLTVWQVDAGAVVFLNGPEGEAVSYLPGEPQATSYLTDSPPAVAYLPGAPRLTLFLYESL